MDEYRRQGGLDYIRMFVTATTAGKSNESTEFFQQLAELKNYYPDQYYNFFGIFWALGSLTATKEDWLRGYLVDADLTPLSDTKIAARLQISKKQAGQSLSSLKRVGLIELIECPDFVRPQQEKSKSKAQKRTGKTTAQQAIRKHSETFPNVSEPFKNNNRNSNRIENKTIKKNKSTRQRESGPKANAHIKQNEQQATPPMPIMPTTSDAGGSVENYTGPPGSVYAKEPSHISHAAEAVRRRCNQAAQSAAREVYEALDGPYEISSPQAARELGAFSSAFEKIFFSGLSPPDAQELWDSLINEAKRLRKIYKSNGGYVSAKKVWFRPVFIDKLAARLKVK